LSAVYQYGNVVNTAATAILRKPSDWKPYNAADTRHFVYLFFRKGVPPKGVEDGTAG